MKRTLQSVFLASMLFLAGAQQAVFAMASRPVDPNAPPPPAWTQWVPILVMVAVFYFLLIRPQSKQRKQREQMITNLKKGDRVLTNGGFVVTVVGVSGDMLDVKINDETKAKLKRSGVAEVLGAETAAVVATVGAEK